MATDEQERLDYHDPEWVAQQLGIDKNAVYKYLNDGVLPGLQIGRKWLISESTLVQFLKAEERQQMAARGRAAWSKGRFEEFSEKARQVLILAQGAAQSRQHNYIGQEHLLLGLAAVRDAMAATALTNLGLSTEAISEAVHTMVGEGSEPTPLGAIGMTPRAKKTLELAGEEAKALNHSYLGTEHLLLGIVAEGSGVGAGILKAKGISEEAVRAEVARLLDSDQRQSAGEPGA